MDLFQMMAFLAGALVVVSTLPQVFKTLKTKEVDELSLPMFIMLIFAQTLWLTYGFHLNDLPLIITNALSMIIITINIALIIRYRYGKSAN